MNYLEDAKLDLHRSNTSQYLNLYLTQPYPTRLMVDTGLRDLEDLAVKLGLRINLDLNLDL